MSVLGSLPYVDQARTAAEFVRRFGVGAEQLRILKHYLSGELFPEFDDKRHLNETLAWLARAQDASGGGGVSNLFYFKSGWGVAYPETSGYILATFLAYSDHCGDASYVDRAIRIGDWEIAIQASDGGVLSSTELPQTRVFNTGQVILGWCALYERTGDERYLEAARRAGDYLSCGQESDGAWRRNTYCGARTYHARVDWALLRLAQATGESKFAHTALGNLRWVLERQRANGWFDECGFDDDLPIMHVIVYTLRGMLESSQIASAREMQSDLLAAVARGADALCEALQAQPVRGIAGMVPTAFDENWSSVAKDSCLTGNAQLACLMYRLAHCTGRSDFRTIADTVVSATKRTQLIETSLEPIRGAVGGTYPLSHGYVPNGYPNWAAKFLADALLMKMNFERQLVVQA